MSLEGTLAGVVGSLIMGGMGVGLGLLPLPALGYTAGAAFLANYVESLLGACLQNDKHPWATNEVRGLGHRERGEFLWSRGGFDTELLCGVWSVW